MTAILITIKENMKTQTSNAVDLEHLQYGCYHSYFATTKACFQLNITFGNKALQHRSQLTLYMMRE